MDAMIGAFLTGLFTPETSERLEKKAWFRALRLIQGILSGLVVLVTLAFSWTMYDTKTVIGATVQCKDGTKWNAFKNGEFIDGKDMCGLCTKRSADNKKYDSCSVMEWNFDSYNVVDHKYRRTSNGTQIILYPAIFLLVSLLIVKGVSKGVVYIVAGSEEKA